MADYNFFAAYQRKKELKIDVHSPYFWGIVIVGICVLFSVALVARNVILSTQIASLQSRTAAVESTEAYQEASELQDTLDAMDAYDAKADSALENFQNAELLDTDLIYAIMKCIPQSAVVISFSVDDGNLGMVCEVPNRKIASELLLNLKNADLFDSVQIYSVSEMDDGNFSASFSGVLKAGDEE